MFIVTAKFPRRRLFLAALCLLVLIALPFFLSHHGESKDAGAVRVKTNDERVAYLRSLGWEVTPEPVETLSVTLPDELVEPYLSYNALQLEQGFDLSNFCGRTLSRYTYAVTNYPDRESGCQADIYLCDDAVVAGDIVCTGEGGFMTGLEFPEKQS